MPSRITVFAEFPCGVWVICESVRYADGFWLHGSRMLVKTPPLVHAAGAVLCRRVAMMCPRSGRIKLRCGGTGKTLSHAEPLPTARVPRRHRESENT